MRASTTTSSGTVYYLYDGSGPPSVEESYNSSTSATSISYVNVMGADGWRVRYQAATPIRSYYAYDPQGTVVNRSVDVSSPIAVDGEPCTDVCIYDGYGEELNDQWAGQTVDVQYTPNDPVGFESQYGYYGDWLLAQKSTPATHVNVTFQPSLLTHRYYDPTTGRFINRDPTGYGGGPNLYGYCDGNQVNERDPEGTGGYWASVGQVFIGYGKLLNDLGNPWQQATNAYNLYQAQKHMAQGELVNDLIVGGVNSLTDCFTTTDPQKYGESVGNWAVIAATAGAGGAGEGVSLADVPAANYNSEISTLLSKDAPYQVTPGVRELEGQHLTNSGTVQPWKAHYDENGRMIDRTDYNAPNPSTNTAATHYHTYVYTASKRGSVPLDPIPYAPCPWSRGGFTTEVGQHIPGEYKP